MIKESYDFTRLGEKPYFYFESEGEQGIISKVIIFSYLEDESWNLAFGDLKGGDIDDSVISNNYDIVKLVSTIAKVVYEFSAEYPSRHIVIEPVDEKRKKLYNHIFRRNYEDILLTFHIIGTYNGNDENYSPKKFYDIFKLIRKFA